jgi:hypothetical protein
MDIENQRMTVRVNNFNEEHFKSIGYNVRRNEYIEIFVKELPIGSGLKIDVECNYCGKIFKKAYRRYLETKENLCCVECRDIKMMETSLERYGNICSLRNPEILQKAIDKNLKTIGVEYPFQNVDILKKCADSLCKNGSKKLFCISNPQKYLHALYGGKINKSEFPYKLDIFFSKENIYLEYDGSGHRLGIKYKNMSEDIFEAKEIRRSEFLKDKGYKEFRIISNNDVFPLDEELINIKNVAFDYLLNKGYQKYIYNLNTKIESFEE